MVTAQALSGIGARIRFDQVSVHAGGNIILKDLYLEVAGGSHVAIAGSSVAGKSSLVGLLFGVASARHRPGEGPTHELLSYS